MLLAVLCGLVMAGCAARKSEVQAGLKPETRPSVELRCGPPNTEGMLVRLNDWTSHPLPGVAVEIRRGPQLVGKGTTDLSGEVLLPLPRGGNLVVTASYAGFHPLAATPVRVRSGCVTVVAAQLEVASACGGWEVAAEKPKK